MNTSIAIADSQNIYREGLIHTLSAQKGFEIACDTDDGLTLIRSLKKRMVDMVIIDVDVKGLGGFETALIIRKKYPKLKIIILSKTNSDFAIIEFFKLGVNTFLVKDINKKVIVKAINKLKTEQYFFHQNIPVHIRNLVITNSYDLQAAFSEKEIEIIKLICDEKSNQDIADILCLSRRTIEWHRRTIQSKMKVKTPIGILKYAIHHQIYKV